MPTIPLVDLSVDHKPLDLSGHIALAMFRADEAHHGNHAAVATYPDHADNIRLAA